DGVDGGAVALAITSVYNLSYTGQTNTTIGATDFVSTKVRDLSIIAGTAGKTILFIAGNGTITGSLRVDNGETLDLNNGGARILTASGNTAAHTVNGTVTGGQFEITGTAASLTGGSGTGNASLVADLLVDPATSGTFTSTGMKALTVLTINRTGLVSTITFNTATASMTTFTNTAGTTTLNMNSTASAIAGNFTVTAGAVTLIMNGAAAGTRTIAGTLGVNGGTLTLGSHINVSGATSQAGDGSLILGDNNLTLADNYTHAGTGTVSAGTGAIVAAVGATKNYTFTTTVNFPNFTLNSPGFGIAFVTNGLTVTTKFVHTAGDLNLGTLPLTLAGNGYTFTAGTYTSGGAAGAVHLTGTAMVIDGTGNPSMGFVALNSTGTVTLNPDNTTSPATARTLTASSGFTHTKGTLALGVNDVIITGGAYSYTAGTITTTTSSSVTATNTNIGEVVFNGGSLTPATGSTLSIPNVRFEAAGAATGTVAFTVANRFTFGKGNVTLGSAGRMTLSDGAVVVRVENTGTLSHAPTFANVVDVLYLNANLPATIVTGVELPTATTALRNLTVNVAIGTGASQTVQLSANATVNGTLSLTSGILDLTTSSKVLNVAVGATVVRQSAGSVNSALTPAGAYNLTYTGNGDFASSSNEWPSTATITTFTVSVGGTTTDRTLNLHASRTVGAFVLNCTTNGSGIDLSNAGTAYTLTVTGVSTLTKGIVKTTTVGGTLAVQGDVNAAGGSFGTTVQMSFTGSANQTITTPAGGATIGNVTINKTGTTPVPTVTIAGGNLGINGVMTFVNGLVATGSNVLILAAPAAPFQGFDRTGVTGSYLSHVVGSVRKTLANVGTIVGSTNERSEFPVGTSTLYRPAAVTFKPNFGIPTIPNGLSITINHVATKPTGTVGLPIVDGVTTGVSIARYADFYWNIVSNASIGNTKFDLELTAAGYSDFDAIANVRIIRRLGTATDVANAWSLQGNPVEYDNFVAGGIPTVVNVNSVGGIRPEGGIFTYGLKSTLFVQNPIGNITLPDGARTFTKSLVSPPLFGGTRGTVTLSATSANTAIATATIANNVLTVKGLIPGSTTITINAIDSEVGQIGYSFTANVTGVTDVEVVEAVPTEFALSQNYPNPFNPSTTIKFALPTAAPVTLEIYNTLGVKVRTLIAGDMMAAKFHQITWNGTDESGSVVPSGMYLYRLVAGDFKASKKMMMLK
ncbi:MAG: T9SS type A sorting domain-containing protein, partial [Ignavibacteria bacterium]|nr:T9SS type A sorting domain-containing protein [Ignavibacteria bacterium]